MSIFNSANYAPVPVTIQYLQAFYPTKTQVIAQLASYLPLSGGTMTGVLGALGGVEADSIIGAHGGISMNVGGSNTAGVTLGAVSIPTTVNGACTVSGTLGTADINANGLLNTGRIEPNSSAVLPTTIQVGLGAAMTEIDIGGPSTTAYVFNDLNDTVLPAAWKALALNATVETNYTPTIGDGTHNFTLSSALGNVSTMFGWVEWQVDLTWTSKNSATGNVVVSLPYIAGNGTTTGSANSITISTSSGFTYSNQLVGFIAIGDLTASIWDLSKTGGSPTQITCSTMSSTGILRMGGRYLAAV